MLKGDTYFSVLLLSTQHKNTKIEITFKNEIIEIQLNLMEAVLISNQTKI
jgi:hypothetical protein